MKETKRTPFLMKHRVVKCKTKVKISGKK